MAHVTRLGVDVGRAEALSFRYKHRAREQEMRKITNAQHEAFAGLVEDQGMKWAVTFAREYMGTVAAALLVAHHTKAETLLPRVAERLHWLEVTCTVPRERATDAGMGFEFSRRTLDADLWNLTLVTAGV